MDHNVEGLDVMVTLTCTKCGTTTDEGSQDPDYTGEEAIDSNGWGYSNKDTLMTKLICDDCLEAEGE
jgi:hypothetical protein